MGKFRSIAIDGPSGAGKSSLSRFASKTFSFVHVDTGAIYRSVGLFCQRNGIASKDTDSVSKILAHISIEINYIDGAQHILLNGEDVSKEIRLPEISIYASDVSAMPPVRAFLLEMQRDIAGKQDVIMDGRDIGTVVLPNADLKIFLTATDVDRAKRRYEEFQRKGINSSFEEVLRDLRYRDENDSSRAISPLKPADDAIILDTTGNTLAQSEKLICTLIAEKLGL